jgi:peroxiredoxin
LPWPGGSGSARPAKADLRKGHERSCQLSLNRLPLITMRQNRAMPDPERRVKLPVPDDDGDADHLMGMPLPAIQLPASDGHHRRLVELPTRSVVFVYPSIGGTGRDGLLEEWTAIPGARGCTPEACSFRDELARFETVRAEVFGLSSQNRTDQAQHVKELDLPYPLLSDESLQLSEALGLPTFEFQDRRFYKRLTLIAAEGTIEAALYPVFPPDDAAAQALDWLNRHPLV